jgi:hypothetical protein
MLMVCYQKPMDVFINTGGGSNPMCPGNTGGGRITVFFFQKPFRGGGGGLRTGPPPYTGTRRVWFVLLFCLCFMFIRSLLLFSSLKNNGFCRLQLIIRFSILLYRECMILYNIGNVGGPAICWRNTLCCNAREKRWFLVDPKNNRLGRLERGLGRLEHCLRRLEHCLRRLVYCLGGLDHNFGR